MLLDNPYPLENLSFRTREVILAEFGGRKPSIREVASIPDHHWLTLPSIGPKVLTQIRLQTRGTRLTAQISPLAAKSDAEVLDEYDRLKDQRKAINDQIKTAKAELFVRGLLSYR